MPTKCVQDKIAAYRKKHNKQPNQSIVGEYQRQCYQNANSLKIRQEEMKNLRDKPRY